MTTLNGGTVSIAVGKTLTVAGGNSSGVISGSGALTSTGNLELSGANTYTGATNITSASVFNLTGSLASGSAVTVYSGATLKGTGTAAGSVTVNGTIAPGATGIGTLTTGATTLNSGGILNIQFRDGSTTAGIGWDILNTDALTIGANSVSKFTINLSTISAEGIAGAALNFADTTDVASPNYYEIISANSINGFSADAFVLGRTFTGASTSGWELCLGDGLLGRSTTSIFAKFTKGILPDGQFFYTEPTLTNGTSASIAGTPVFTSSGSIPVSASGVSLENGVAFQNDFTVGTPGSVGVLNLVGTEIENNITTDAGSVVTINSAITTTTGVTKDGDGKLIITAASNNLGDVDVKLGTLTINGAAVVGTLTVNEGGTLGGSGTIRGNVDVVGGTLSPGNSPGRETINGNLTINDGALIGSKAEIQLGGTVAGTGYDQIVVNGAVNIAGIHTQLNVVQDAGSGFVPSRGDVFQFLTATKGISGNKFETFNSTSPAYANVLLVAEQGTGRIYGTGLADTEDFTDYAENTTSKQNAVYQLVWNSAVSGGTAPSNARFIDGTTFDGKVAAALIQNASGNITSFSPESYFGLTDYALTLSRSISSAAQDQTSFYKIRHWTVGADYNNASNSFNGGSSAAFNRSLTAQTGFMTMKYEFNNSSVGFFVGTNSGSTTTDSTRTDYNGTVFGLTANKSFGRKYPTNLQFAFTHTDLKFDSNRSLLGVASAASTTNQSLTSDSVSALARVQLYKKRFTTFSPYVGVALSRASSSAFTESGAQSALKVGATSVNSTRLSAGFEFDYVPTWKSSYTFTAGFEHELGRAGQTIDANYVGMPAAADKFTTTNPSGNQTTLTLGASADYRLSNTSMLGLGLQLRAGGDYSNDRSVNLSYKKKF